MKLRTKLPVVALIQEHLRLFDLIISFSSYDDYRTVLLRNFVLCAFQRKTPTKPSPSIEILQEVVSRSVDYINALGKSF